MITQQKMIHYYDRDCEEEETSESSPKKRLASEPATRISAVLAESSKPENETTMHIYVYISDDGNSRLRI